MKKHLIAVLLVILMSVLCLSCVPTSSSVVKNEGIAPLGTKVLITKDVRLNGNATGKIARWIGKKPGSWRFYDENGKQGNKALKLPAGYVAWDPYTQEFPGKKCGVQGINPIF